MSRRELIRVLIATVLVLVSLTVRAAAGAEATDQRGQAHSWRAPLPRLTVIDFAASWCGPCRHTLPKLEELAANHPEIDFVVVSVDDTVDGRDDLVRSLQLELPVVWDEGYEIAEHYKPEAMPATLIVDEQGEVLYQQSGSSEASWDRFVDFLESAQRRSTEKE